MMIYIELERAEGWKPVPGLVLASAPALCSTGPWVCPFILPGLEGNPKPWPEELGEWAVCCLSLIVPCPVMGVKKGTQVGSLEVSRLTFLTPRNVGTTWDMKIVEVVCSLSQRAMIWGSGEEPCMKAVRLQRGVLLTELLLVMVTSTAAHAQEDRLSWGCLRVLHLHTTCWSQGLLECSGHRPPTRGLIQQEGSSKRQQTLSLEGQPATLSCFCSQ